MIVAALHPILFMVWLAIFRTASASFNCTFEEGLCDWRQSGGDTYNWHLYQGRLPYSHTRPNFDVTVGVIPRMFLFDSTDDFPSDGGIAVLVEGEDHVFTCLIPDIKHEVELVWTLAGQGVKQVSNRSVVTIDGWDVSSSVVVSPNRDNHRKTLQCEAFDADGELIDNMTVSIAVKATTDFNCTFEEGFCGWRQSNDDRYKWLLQQGRTPIYSSGPQFDRTLGRTLNVYQLPVNQTLSDGEIIFTRSGQYTNGTFWLKARSCVRNATSEFQIALEAVRGYFDSDIAIDDINTVIPRMFLFDSTEDFPSNAGIAVLVEGEDHAFTCMVPDTNHEVEFVWTLAGQRVKQVINRSVDTIDGLSVSSSIVVSPNRDILGKTLQCEAIDADSEPIDSMTVSIAVRVSPKSSLMSLTGPSGNRLRPGGTANVATGIANTFASTVGFNCTFEEGWCGWRQSKEDRTDWSLKMGSTHPSSTGPAHDKTVGDYRGRYAYFHQYHSSEGTNAVLISPAVVPSKEQIANHAWCFSFWYNMYGSNMGTLNASRVAIGESVTEGEVLFSRSGEQTNRTTWLEEEICVTNLSSSFFIAFEGIRGNGSHSDIAIDDVESQVPRTSIIIFDWLGDNFYMGDTVYAIGRVFNRFTCRVPDIRAPVSLSWTFGGLEVSPDSYNNVTDSDGFTTSTSTVTIPISESDHGELLECVAFVAETHPVVNIFVTVHVQVPPAESSLSLYDSGGNLTGASTGVVEGAPHSFLCSVSQTRPAATIQWFLNDALQRTVDPPSGESDGLVDTTSNWTFVPSRANHGQRVKCVASTAESELPLPFVMVTVDVTGPPDTPAVSGNLSMTANETVQVTCQASHGYPDDWELAWTNGGLPLAGTHTTAMLTSGNRYRFSSTLNFTPTREDNGNMITCSTKRGSWDQDPIGSLGPIDVQYCPEFSAPPEITSRTFEEEDNVIFSCSADANPMPPDFITWERVESPGSLPSLYSNGTSTLLLINISREQAGTYRCRGDNGVPPVVYSSLVDVIVRSPVAPSVIGILISWPYLTAISVLGILLLISIAIQAAGYFYRKRKRPPQKKEQQNVSQSSEDGTGGPVRVVEDTECYENVGIPMQTIRAVESKPVESTYADIPDCRAAISRDQLTFLQELTQGTFGKVLLARALDIKQPGLVTRVAVKTVKDESDPKEKENLIRELNSMKPLSGHANIVKLLGYCINEDPIYVIMEHMANGNLKDILTDSRSEHVYDNLRGAVCASLTPKTLLSLARGVAEGMAYLASQGCLHQDLAARNVLVSEDMVSKISDFGFASDVAEMRTYQRKRTGFSPLRWMALESVVDDVYTTESDVWSFGVLLWEIVTLGGHPYPTMSAKKVVSKVKSGYRMPRPDHCRLQLYQVVRACWSKNPAVRPTFATITDKLGGLLGKANECILLESCQENIYKMSVSGGSDFEKI
ncbi:uncharacterized protein LOC119733008 [Patiria miniata]|uniref:Receptor protein-tyrosine kinase n=1 Tax=Patiria miniata TaxID=46514 RepID=A0A914AFK3_PATMI|nr:uncharacterized protein LOC119733008 [Patiria miniata]